MDATRYFTRRVPVNHVPATHPDLAPSFARPAPIYPARQAGPIRSDPGVK